MVNLLDIHVEVVTPESVKEYDRIAMVDVQPHYFGGPIDRVDLVIDHHPEQAGYTAVFKDIRAGLRVDLRRSSPNIFAQWTPTSPNAPPRRCSTRSSRTRCSSTARPTASTSKRSRICIRWRTPALIRKMEGAEITAERLDYVMKAHADGRLSIRSSAPSWAPPPREDFIPYVADFFLQLEDVKWTVIAGVVNDSVIISVSNLGYSRNAGEFVRRYFADIGNAGGHRAMAKAVVPLEAFTEKFGEMSPGETSVRLQELITRFLHEVPAAAPDKKRETVRST